MKKQWKITRKLGPVLVAFAGSFCANISNAETAIEDFDISIHPFSVFQGAGTQSATFVADGDVPDTAEGNRAVNVSYADVAQYGGAQVELSMQDWSGTSSVSFYFKGTNSAINYSVEIRDGGAKPDVAEAWTSASFADDSVGWKLVTLNFTDFTINGWQPCQEGEDNANSTVCNGSLDLSAMTGFVILTPWTTTNSYSLDSVIVDRDTDTEVVVETFDEALNPPSVFQGAGTTTLTHVFAPMSTDPSGGGAAHVSYSDIAQYGGFQVELEPSAHDWSAATTLDFEFKGTNSGLNYVVGVREGGTAIGNSEEWSSVSFADDSSDWKTVSLRLDDFTVNGWQPCLPSEENADAAICDGSFALTGVNGIVVNSPQGTVDSYTIDGIVLDHDVDNDGVLTIIDTCASTPEDEDADPMTGCSASQTDDDMDGVPGNIDECPDSPIGFDVDATGCNVDTDEDGIPDPADECVDSSEDLDNGLVVGGNGCTLAAPTFASAPEEDRGAGSSDLFTLFGLLGLGVVGFRRRRVQV